MSIEKIKSLIPDYAKDIRLNLSSVLTVEGAPGLTEQQLFGVALTAAIVARNQELTKLLLELVSDVLSAEEINGVKAAAAIMGMNNVYYRFLHLTSDEQYKKLPARLRMNIIANPGIDKINFELYSLAASAINACELCVDSHEKHVRNAGISIEGVQSVVRIAAVIHAAAVTIEQEQALT